MLKSVNNSPNFSGKWSVYRESMEKMPSFVDIKAKRDVMDFFKQATSDTKIVHGEADSIVITGHVLEDYKKIEGKSFVEWIENLLESSLFTIKQIGK